MEGGETITRSYTLPVHGPGDHQVSLSLPLSLTVGEGVDDVQISVRVEVKYLTNDAGEVTVRDLETEAGASPEPEVPGDELPPKKGFFGRLFGGG